MLAAGISAVLAGAGLATTAAPASATVAACSSVGLTVSALHGPNFYIDSGISPQLMGAYAGYRVANTGSARSDLWVKLANFSGGRVGLGTGQAASMQIASLAGGAGQSLFWFLSATGTGSGPAQNHDVQVWSGRPDLPGSSQLCGTTGGFSAVSETIKAAANKLTSVTVDGGTPTIGATFTITVNGQTGTVGDGPAGDYRSFWMTPAASSSWPAGAYRLVGTSLTLQGTTYTDQLRVASLNSASSDYTATYTFRAVGYTASAASLVPIQQITSGTQVKHTDLGSLASLPAITPATNDLLLAKTADVSFLPSAGGDVHYEVAVTGTAGAVIDDFADTVPSGATLVPGSVTWRGSTVPDGVLSGGVLTFSGPFTVGAGTSVLGYTLTLPAVSGDRANSVVAHVGSATVDASLSLTNDTAAGATVHVNGAPTAVDDTTSATQDVPATVTVLGNDSDPENDPLTITAVSTPSHGTAATTAGDTKILYTPDSGYVGTDQLTYDVSDGNGGTDTATVDVTVNVPGQLTLAADTATATSGVATDVDVLGNDTGNAPLVVTAAGTPAHGTVQVAADGSTVTYTPDAAYEGSDSFTYDVEDATTQTGQETVTVTVAPPALVATDDTGTTDDTTPVTIDLLDNDHGFGALAVDSVTQPANGSVVDNHDGTVTYTPAAGQLGDDTFTYDVTDGAATPRTDTASVTVTVSATTANDPVDDTATTPYDESVLVDVLSNDPGSPAIDEVGTPAHGTAVVESGQVRYTPPGDFAGTDTFTYTVTGSATAAEVSVDVTAPALSAADDTATSGHGASPVTVHVRANDTGTGLTVTDVSDTDNGGTAQIVGGSVRVTPAAGFRGADALTYTVTDVVGNTDTATIDLTVPNTAPTVSAPAARTIVAGSATTFTLTVGDADPDDDPTVTTGTPTGSANAATRITRSVGTSGGSPTVRVAAATTFSGSANVPVTVSDGHGGTATTTLRVTVTPQAPTGVTAGVVGNPAAKKIVEKPTYDAKGAPVSRTLTEQIDSRITWRVSPTTSVTGYVVRVNGAAVCEVAAAPLATTQSCTVADRALRTTDTVTVTALGPASTRSTAATVPVSRPTSARHLLAVVYFPVGDFRLDATARAVLARVDAQAVRYGMRSVRLEGHTDADGSASSNQTLSENRSRQVGQWLVERDERVRVRTAGFGETDPALPNTTARGKAGNRRVEIYVGD